MLVEVPSLLRRGLMDEIEIPNSAIERVWQTPITGDTYYSPGTSKIWVGDHDSLLEMAEELESLAFSGTLASVDLAMRALIRAHTLLHYAEYAVQAIAK